MFKWISLGILLTCISTLTLAADVQISQLTDSPDPAIRNGEITYSIALLNNNADTANDVTLAVPLPATTSFVSVNNANCIHDGGTPGTLNCSFGNITGDGLGSPVINVDLVIRSSATTGSTISVTATVATTSPDTNNLNDSLSQITTIDNGADLAVSIVDSQDPVIAGSNYSYTITAQNLGPNNANAITLVNTLPTGVSFQSASGSGWSCSDAGQTVTCTRATINNGVTAPALTINGKVTSAISGTITDTVTISATTGDPDPNNNTTTENTVINQGTDLTMSKSVAGPVIGNTTTTFTLEPRNLGPYNASTVTVTDTLPVGFTFINATGTGWSCGEAIGVVTCTRASYNIGATDDITIQTSVPATGSNITNTASISSATTEAIVGNNTDTVNFSIVPDGADLSITKVKTPDPVAQGANMNSVIRVFNNGPQSTTGIITVIDTLDVNETFISNTGTNWSCSHLAGTVTCEYRTGGLPGGTPITLNNGANTSQLTIVTQANVTGNATDSLTNTACASDAGGLNDAIAGNNCASATVTSTQNSVDLSIVKAVATAGGVNNTLEIGENRVTYTLTVTSDAASDTLDGNDTNALVVTDVIPGFVSGVVNATPNTTVINVSDNSGGKFNCNIASATVTCTLAAGQTFVANESVIFTIDVDRPLASGALTNTATVHTESLGEPNLLNNSSSAGVNIASIADVEMVSIGITPDPTKAGTDATYVLTFRNNGPGSADAVVLTHNFTPPAGRTFQLSAVTPSKGSCLPLAGNTLTCNVGSLNRNEQQTITMTVRPGWDGANSAWTMGNNATIVTSTTESDGTNNSANQDLNVVLAEIDLLINKTDLVDPLGWVPAPIAFPTSLDNVIVYKVDVTNRGPSEATGLTFSDVLTPKTGKQLTFLCDDSSSSSCAIGTSLCNNTGVSATGPASIGLNCPLADMEANTTTTRYLFFQVDTQPDSTGDTHNNVVTVTSNEDDTVPSNDTESETTSVRVRVDIAVDKTPSQPVVSLYEPFTWNINVSNNGPGISANSTLLDTLPSGMELTATPTPPQGSCTGNAGDTSFTCNLGDINSGANAIVSVPVRITAFPSGGAITNTANVTTFGVDSDGSNNTDSGTVNVTRSSIAGTVFNDQNDNGEINTSEHGITGVSLTLTGNDQWGNAVNQSTTTDADGNYSFNNLAPGTNYTITETQPTNFTDGLDDNSGSIDANSRTTDQLSNIGLSANTNIIGYNFGELGNASISGIVWYDENNNATVDATETTGIPNTTITLTGTETVSGKALSITTQTDNNGIFQFVNLTSGTYALVESQPFTWGDGMDAAGSAGGVVSNDNISNITVLANQNAINYRFGELGGSISGKVYRDWNNNATHDGSNEAGIANVTITLTGTDGDGDSVNRTTQTDKNGNYLFIGLESSDATGYRVRETQPQLIFDGKDSVGSLGGTLGNDVLSNIVLPANGVATDYNFGEGADIRSSISGIVFIDLNNNGLKEEDEIGLKDITLSLNGKNRLGHIVTIQQVTDSNGYYIFANLAGSNSSGYTITQTHPEAYADGLDSKIGSIVTNSRHSDTISNIFLKDDENLTENNFAELYKGQLSGAVFIDKNDDGQIDAAELGIESVNITLSGTDYLGRDISRTTTTDETGQFSFAQVPPSKGSGYTITESQPSDYHDGLDSAYGTLISDSRTTDEINSIKVELDTNESSFNFGEIFSASISGYVYHDTDDNGLKASGELGLENIVVSLSGKDEQGNAVNLSQQTDEEGYYLFDQLPPSDIEGYTVTAAQAQNYLDGLDSKANKPIEFSHYTDEITSIHLTANGRKVMNNFGELDSASLSGTVWVDENDNGEIDSEERLRIANVSVSLAGIENYKVPAQEESSKVNQIGLTAQTDEDGNYVFTNLRAGSYTITQTQPSAWLDGKDHLGTLGGNKSNDEFTDITLAAGTEGSEYNFGERGSDLAGIVFSDLNDNGEKDASDAGIPEVQLQLIGIDLDGQPVNRGAQTVITGDYLFEHLPLTNANGFTVIETQPANMEDGKDSAGSHGGITETNDEISDIIFTEHITHAIEYNFAERLLDPARISGTVWLDKNHNRDEDDSNGLEGWTVELLLNREDAKDNNNFTVIATVITDENGDYLFDGLSEGIYEVRFTHPDGGTIYGYPVSDEPGAEVDMGTIRYITLESGQHVDEQNLPIDPSGIVYDSQTREPVAGATVEIAGPAGFNPASDLVGGTDNKIQVTDETGMYQFLLFTSAPSGTYELVITEPSGYLPDTSSFIPVCENTPSVVPSPNPALVQWQSTPPSLSASILQPEECATISSGFEQNHGSTQYYLTFNIDPLAPSANVVNNHIPLDPVDDSLLTVSKSADKKQVSRGELIPYTIIVSNNVNVTLEGVNLIDKLPAGFKYLPGSSTIDGTSEEPDIEGLTITWPNLTIEAGQQVLVKLLTVAGTGLGEGEYVNQAWANDMRSEQALSNISSASVRIVPDPIFDCSDIVGKVFNDKNANGYQDEEEAGLAGARIATAQGLLVTTDKQGRYHITCADMPNEMRGGNFILKLDERTLPSGYRITTENPRVVRLTRGKLSKANFGATVHRVMRIQLTDDAFEQDTLKSAHWQHLANVLPTLAAKPSILRLAYQQQGEGSSLVEDRIEELIERIEEKWQSCDCDYELLIEQEIQQGDNLFEVESSTGRVDHD